MTDWTIYDESLRFSIVSTADNIIQSAMRMSALDLVDITGGPLQTVKVTPAHTEQAKNRANDYIDTVFQRGVAPAHTQNYTTPNVIQQIKRAHPIAPHVARYTGGLRPSGGNEWFIGRCPFHQPATDPPNKRKFWVNIKKGVCGCFVPRCEAHQPMDIINFEALRRGISNKEAIDALREAAR